MVLGRCALVGTVVLIVLAGCYGASEDSGERLDRLDARGENAEFAVMQATMGAELDLHSRRTSSLTT